MTETTILTGKRGTFVLLFFFVVMFIGFIALPYFIPINKNKSFIMDDMDGMIYYTGELNEGLKRMMLIIKKSDFSDSSHSDADEILAELELIHDKLIKLKMKLKNKPWAN